MAEKFPIDRYNFLEVQVKYYMQCLLVENPEQVVQYLKKRLKMYSAMLKKKGYVPSKRSNIRTASYSRIFFGYFEG